MSVRSASVSLPRPKIARQPERRVCTGCCEEHVQDDANKTGGTAQSRFVKPCRLCNSDYCIDCLKEMFTTKDNMRMPARCCAILQPYVASNLLSAEEIEDYRVRFEEWAAADRTYCPSPTCSAFISKRYLEASRADGQASKCTSQASTLQSVLNAVLKRVHKSQSARFFRTAETTDKLPNYKDRVKTHMDLSIVQEKISTSYKSVSDMASDFRLMYINARQYNGLPTHPVVAAAERMNAEFLGELSTEVNTLIAANQKAHASLRPAQIFGCPKCHLAICVDCRQVEHTGKPCDHSQEDQETAMLKQFGYKRCPKCRTGVKKMYGCPHMLCRCGAHWCYYCQKSSDLCQGNCEEGHDSDEDDEEDYSDEDIDMQEGEKPGDGKATEQKHTTELQEDLDRGGGRRWNNGDYDFGSEPADDEELHQLWNCKHEVRKFEPHHDKYNRGDVSQIECNVCFQKLMEPVQPAPAVRLHRTYAAVAAANKRKRNDVKDEEIARHPADADHSKVPTRALECRFCYYIFCPECAEQHSKKSLDSK